MTEKQKPELLTFKDNYLVTKSNTLIMKASYELSVEEQRIVLLLISKIQPTDEQFKEYILKVTDYMKFTDKSGKSAYNEMKKSIIKLMERLIYIIIEGKNGPLICHWISSTQVDAKSGEFQISIHPELQQFLLRLIPKEIIDNSADNAIETNKEKTEEKVEIIKEKITPYTSYKYSIARKLKSKYSYHLYEMLKCNEYRGNFNISLDEFKKLMLIEGTSYENYGNINRRILKTCIQEINDITDITFNIKTRKDNKKVVELIFTIKPKKAKK